MWFKRNLYIGAGKTFVKHRNVPESLCNKIPTVVMSESNISKSDITIVVRLVMLRLLLLKFGGEDPWVWPIRHNHVMLTDSKLPHLQLYIAILTNLIPLLSLYSKVSWCIFHKVTIIKTDILIGIRNMTSVIKQTVMTS